MQLERHATTIEKIWHYVFLTICAAVLLFLIAPILIIIPLSFNQEPYFSFTKGMLSLDPEAWSLRWYRDMLENGTTGLNKPWTWAWVADVWNNAQWVRAMRNSFFIGIISTILATALGTLAALGLSRAEMPYRAAFMSLLISPMIVPVIVTATGSFFFLASIGLVKTYTGVIIIHVMLGIPFVIITVTSTLAGFDRTLIRAFEGMGATQWTTFHRVIMPLILPGMVSGALFAFVTSFDEVVAVLFVADIDQRTIPCQMWSGVREQISPTILAVATVLVVLSVGLLSTVEILRRRSERMRGVSPQ